MKKGKIINIIIGSLFLIVFAMFLRYVVAINNQLEFNTELLLISSISIGLVLIAIVHFYLSRKPFIRAQKVLLISSVIFLALFALYLRAGYPCQNECLDGELYGMALVILLPFNVLVALYTFLQTKAIS